MIYIYIYTYIPICHTAFSFPQSCSSCLFHIVFLSFPAPSRTAHRLLLEDQ